MRTIGPPLLSLLFLVAPLAAQETPPAPPPPRPEREPADKPVPDLLPANPGLDLGIGGHWGLARESDWVDDRWSKMDTGPFVCASFDDGPPQRVVAKGMAIRVGDGGEGAVCFDEEHLSLRAGWTGGFVRFSSRMYGLVENPRFAGDVRFRLAGGPAWEAERARLRGFWVHGDRVVLSYRVGESDVLDSPWLETAGGAAVFTRTLEIGAGDRALSLRVAEVELIDRGQPLVASGRLVALESGKDALAASVAGWGPATLEARGREIVLRVPPRRDTARVRLSIWSGEKAALESFEAAVAKAPAPAALEAWTRPGATRWPRLPSVAGRLDARESPWAIDTVPVPYDNPHRSPMFITGLDFFDSGDAAVCTIYGDVWLVRGIDASLGAIAWKRFAAGLYQPFGVRIAGGRVHVLGRDQITVLHDRDGDDEADVHETFCNAWETIPWPHHFSAGLETDAAGNFYFVSPRGAHRVSRDGGAHEIIARGWRNPISLAVAPDGTMTVAPQEGEWTPASQICEVRAGGYYGYPGPEVAPERPLGYDPPLCYIPRHIDSSSGGQAWVASDRWAPLEGQLLGFSYGRCSMYLILRDSVDGVAQGGVVPLRGRFLSGAMRGRFHPRDGQLWVAGSSGWVTSAAADGSLQRVRYTGSRIHVPTSIHAHSNGLRIGFSDRLDREVAEDPRTYVVETWGYRYAKDYGSEEYSVAQPEKIGHDAVAVRAATLLEDGKSVFLEMPSIRPVMQMHVRGTLEAEDGAELPLEIYNTIHRLRPALAVARRDGSDPVARRDDDAPTLAADADVVPAGLPGLHLRIESRRSPASSDERVSRLAALSVPAGASPSPFLDAGPFRARWSGRLHVEERSRVAFSAEGRGAVRLSIDGEVAFEGAGEDLSALRGKPVRLERGGRAVELEYRSPESGDAWLRLHQEGRGFPREPVPPTLFTHDPSPGLARATALRRGREVFAARRCARCHAAAEGAALLEGGMPELAFDAPSFRDIGARLRSEWMERWIADPRSIRPTSVMPALAGLLPPGTDEATVARRARDIAAYLAAQGGAGAAASASSAAADDGTQAAAGGALFKKLGCIACHTLPGAAPAAAPEERVGLAGLAGKWRPGALSAYLREPGRHYVWTSMPDFKLTEPEAAALAAFLLAPPAASRTTADTDTDTDTDPATDTDTDTETDTDADTDADNDADANPPAARRPHNPGDVERGREAVATLGCLACHDLPLETSRRRAPPLDALARADWSASGCVAESPGAPRLGLSSEEREALRLFGSEGLPSLGRRNLAEFAERRIRDLRCGACHDRDGRESDWTRHAGEAAHLSSEAPRDSLEIIPGLAVQTRPSLTHAGDKLRAEWLGRFLGGALDDGPRPWLDARMPRFAAGADLLARGIALDHGRPLETPPAAIAAGDSGPAADRHLGERLAGRDEGFGCVTCHAAGDRPAEMQLHFGVINLRHARARLHRDYYLRWMLDPQRIQPGTPMPVYTDEDGITPFTQILGGDGRKQFEAIWEYLGMVR